MQDTEKGLIQAVSKVDLVLEILDARLPCSSANPFVDKLSRKTTRLKILNKQDLADPDVTVRWLDYFNQTLECPAVSITGTNRTETIKALNFGLQRVTRNKARKAKVMVAGIPNTGKSTILNTLAGKKVAKTGNVPAITRHQQRTSLVNNVDIYDTPGILWPVIEPQSRAYILAASGAISDTAIDYTEIAFYISDWLLTHYPDALMARFDFLESLPASSEALIEAIGKARGCLKKGGIVNLQKASELLIRELRSGKFGTISFETPEDIDI